ncbi:IscS subfamily cysteine desulfurase [Pseudalkalibacillus caeni]|uniref:Aminotransferase class V-fold PLP-dependent enzyme n=1 Tax=Exobacillus caeni TaxID=2574798 RepID=A0A5R9F6P7_9BACL|nr:IscS subfamily cysteine desulfurase [Pseudalkalibacillus caeni]TLS39257.1 aminotransferase class V-fold PLP-dependent enzyme [Pseudalkalibacillus caeni]
MIYLDYASTTPMSDKALEVYTEAARHYFGNPRSSHDIGTTASQLLEASRRKTAELFNGSEEGVYFTGGGSEANDLAIRSLVKASKKGNHLITTSTEHSSVLNTFKTLEEEGYRVTYLPVNEYGEVEMKTLKGSLTPETALVSIAHANSEIGAVQKLKEIGQLLAEHNILFHSDCVQTFGKLPLDVRENNLSSISVSGHKIYGPKGVGVCYIAPHVSWGQVIPGTTHENGFRPGTVNVPGIAAFVTAAEDAVANMCKERNRYAELRKKFASEVCKHDRIVIEGHQERALPHIIGLRVKGIEGQYIMLECNRHGFAVSTGSACSIGQQSPSKTLLAIGRDQDEARELVRITFGKFTTEEDVEKTNRFFTQLMQNFEKAKV